MISRQQTNNDSIGPRILIVEPNPYHGEILPGFVYYFQKMDYSVSVLMRKELRTEDPFCLYPNEQKPQLIYHSRNEMKEILIKNNFKQYDFIFFSTNVIWESDKIHSEIREYLGIEPEGKYKSLYVEHNLLTAEEDNSIELFSDRRAFTLLPYVLKGTKTKMINPHYFGILPKKVNVASEQKKILLVGSSSTDPVNLEKIFAAVENINNKNLKYEILIVGKEIQIPRKYSSTIKCIGRLNFVNYYKVVQEVEYLMTLVDKNSEDIIHKKYYRGTTSGTVQISLGFQKPTIIESELARNYGFNSDSAIMYEEGCLTKALLRALEINTKEYSIIQQSIETLAHEFEKISLTNLKKTTHYLKFIKYYRIYWYTKRMFTALVYYLKNSIK